jgi:hypothetical protein
MEERPRRLPAPTQPLTGNITSLLAIAQSDITVTRALRSCPIIGHGYDSVAAVLRSLGTLPDQHADNASKAAINAERRVIGKWLRDNWTERQWVDSVPWRFRSDSWPASSYQETIATMTEGKVNAWLNPAFLWAASAKLKVGVFLLTNRQASAGPAGVGLYHIGEQQAYSHYIVLQWSSHHFDSCGLPAAHEQLQLRFARDSAVVRALIAATRAHTIDAAAAVVDNPIFIHDDEERLRLEQLPDGVAAVSALLPSPSAPRPAAMSTSLRGDHNTQAGAQGGQTKRAAATVPKVTASRPPAAPQRGGRISRRTASAVTAAVSAPVAAPRPAPSLPAHRRAQSAAPSAAAAAAMQAVDAAVQAVDTSARRAQPSLSASPPELQPTVAQLAAHGVLYDFISFSNVPQWVGMCSSAFNAYRVASERGDSARQTQALIDILMLPQRTLTKLPRGGGKRAAGRLVRTIKARCRDVGAELRRRTGCVDPPDRTVQLTVHTAALITAPSAAVAERSEADAAAAALSPSVADTESDSQSDDGVDSLEWRPAGRRTARPASSAAEPESAEAGDVQAGKSSAAARRPPGPVSELRRAMLQLSLDPDDKAARLANRLICSNHTRRAARALHSTATMADLTQPAVRKAVQLLHPPLPADSVLPRLPADADQVILADGEAMKRIIRSSDNGAAAGPSGWGGGLLAALVESDICRFGIIALLKDILNGDIPDAARQYLLASRLVAITKPDSDSLRPIAVGELFYRLAAVIAVSRTRAAAARLLAPHQYGVGVRSGAERIVHSMQYSLTDRTAKRAALKVDISNAFNSCDRALMLRKLYATPELSSLFRIADFAYSAPSTLLLQRCDGASIESSNGVRQGDPLACLLFCVYMRELYAELAGKADVVLYGFIDDLHIVGSPAEVMKALAALQQLLPGVSLHCNTAKSCLAYFHDDTAPLPASLLRTLAEQDIAVRHDWMEVMGAVVGRDSEAVKQGLECLAAKDNGSEAFFRRLQSPELLVQSALLVLRQCAVPKLNYLLRCSPPACIAEQAAHFDTTLVTDACNKLELRCDERTAKVVQRLRLRLKDGGFGLKSATQTSPAAYTASVAAARDTAVFAPFRNAAHPLPADTLLHSWLTDSMARLRQATPGSQLESMLPPSASSFFSFYANAASTLTSSLQSSITDLANDYQREACRDAAKQLRPQDGGRALAHFTACSADFASAWKRAAPTQPLTTLLDKQYRIAARLNLGLPPLSSDHQLPANCPLCKKGENAVAEDPWHYLVCKSQSYREVSTRHHAVKDALYRAVLLTGGQAVREVKGLDVNSMLRPDLQIVYPGRHVLTDIAVVHPLAVYGRSQPENSTATAKDMEGKKRRKYAAIAKRHDAELIPFAVETCGGLGPDAIALLDVISGAASEHLSLWSQEDAAKEVLNSAAIAVQKGNAMTILGAHAAALLRAA